ncbi:stealth conserved region 3 domain-containing protein [Oricola sp.]|uniref:stealth conserved region 3 domain-containing protein n=1 Tax=Oricola sp. TaxID=1979950 RepID=UPI003BA8E552
MADAPGEIDAVLLWVDGCDPAFRASLAPHIDRSNFGAAVNRFRSNGELRYALRSIERFAPWVRHVHLVTNGQVPGWLDRSTVRLVSHREIFPDPSVLPVFNSCAIELCLHRIEGLSRHFLYMNDDMFFGRPTPREYFFADNGAPKVLFQETHLHDRAGEGALHNRSFGYTQNIIAQETGRRMPRFIFAHAPVVLDRLKIKELVARYAGEVRKTLAHRFRHPEDLSIRVVYNSHVTEERYDGSVAHEVLRRGSDYDFLMLGSGLRRDIRQLRSLRRIMPRLFCINDDLGDGMAAAVSLFALRKTLQSILPDRSGFEMTSEAGPAGIRAGVQPGKKPSSRMSPIENGQSSGKVSKSRPVSFSASTRASR